MWERVIRLKEKENSENGKIMGTLNRSPRVHYQDKGDETNGRQNVTDINYGFAESRFSRTFSRQDCHYEFFVSIQYNFFITLNIYFKKKPNCLDFP